VHIGLHLKQVTHFICRNKFKGNTFRSNTSECCKIFPGRRSALGMPHFCSLLRCICIFVTADHRFFFFFLQTCAICPQNGSAFLYHSIVSYHMRLTNLPSFLENDGTFVFYHNKKNLKPIVPRLPCLISYSLYSTMFLCYVDVV
jgi:hypothetical protein